MINWLNDNQGVLAFVGIVITTLVAYIVYQVQRKKKQLEYVVVSNEPVLPNSISKELKVVYNKNTVRDACVVIIKVVNTGSVPVLKDDFSSDLIFRLEDAQQVVASIPTKTKPGDMRPTTTIERNRVLIQPILINPGDMIELHMLTSGNTSKVYMEGRIAGIKLIHRKNLPYPPGSGPEGELLGFDKFMWYILEPFLFGGILVYQIMTSQSLTIFVKTTIVAAVLFYIFVLNPKYVRHLDNKRGLWR